MKTPQKILAATAVLLMAAFAPSSIQADTLALYAFTAGSATSTAAASPLYTVSAFTPSAAQAANAWLPSATYDNFGFRPYNSTYNEGTNLWTNGQSGLAGGVALTEAMARNNDFYAGFTITPTEGATLTLSSLSLTVGIGDKDGKNFGGTALVFAQIGDGSKVNVGTVSSLSSTSSTTASGGQWNTGTLDLSTISSTAISDPVTFYIYFYGGRNYDLSKYWTFRLDDVTLTGAATGNIPEPSAAALAIGFAAIAGCTIMTIRRRAGKP